MTDFDYYYGNYTLLIKNSTKDTQMGHFANEKLLFSELIQYDSLPPTQQCSSNTGSKSTNNSSNNSSSLSKKENAHLA